MLGLDWGQGHKDMLKYTEYNLCMIKYYHFLNYILLYLKHILNLSIVNNQYIGQLSDNMYYLKKSYKEVLELQPER